MSLAVHPVEDLVGQHALGGAQVHVGAVDVVDGLGEHIGGRVGVDGLAGGIKRCAANRPPDRCVLGRTSRLILVLAQALVCGLSGLPLKRDWGVDETR